MAQPRILQSAPNHMRITAPFGSVALEPGDLCSYESNLVVLMDSATEDASFAGYIVNQNNVSQTEPASGVLGLQGQLRVDCTPAAYVVGQGLKLASANTVVDHGGTPGDTMSWSGEKTNGSVSSLDIIIDVLQVNKLFETVAN